MIKLHTSFSIQPERVFQKPVAIDLDGPWDVTYESYEASLQLVNVMMSKTRRLETSMSNIGKHINAKW